MPKNCKRPMKVGRINQRSNSGKTKNFKISQFWVPWGCLIASISIFLSFKVDKAQKADLVAAKICPSSNLSGLFDITDLEI